MRFLERLAVGLCFSFPMEHVSIKSGKLIKWTKGYQNEGAVGKDPVRLLQDAFKRQVTVFRFNCLLCGNTSGPGYSSKCWDFPGLFALFGKHRAYVGSQSQHWGTCE